MTIQSIKKHLIIGLISLGFHPVLASNHDLAISLLDKTRTLAEITTAIKEANKIEAEGAIFSGQWTTVEDLQEKAETLSDRIAEERQSLEGELFPLNTELTYWGNRLVAMEREADGLREVANRLAAAEEWEESSIERELNHKVSQLLLKLKELKEVLGNYQYEVEIFGSTESATFVELKLFKFNRLLVSLEGILSTAQILEVFFFDFNLNEKPLTSTVRLSLYQSDFNYFRYQRMTGFGNIILRKLGFTTVPNVKNGFQEGLVAASMIADVKLDRRFLAGVKTREDMNKALEGLKCRVQLRPENP